MGHFLPLGMLVICLWMGQIGFACGADATPATEESSIRRWSDAAEVHRQRGESRPWAEALARRAEAYQALGHRRQALADLEQSASLIRDDAPSALRAAILGALGQALFRAGRSNDAERALAVALASADDAGAQRVAAAVLNDQGMLLAAASRREEAQQAFAASVTRARTAGDKAGEGKALLNSARLHHKHSDAASAQRFALAAATGLREPPDSPDKAVNLAAAGALLRELAAAGGHAAVAAAALDTLTAATEIAQRTASARAAAEAWGQLAELRLDQRELQNALALSERALFHAQASQSAEAQFFAQWRTARFLQQANRLDEATGAFRRALTNLAQIKADIAAELWARQESFTERIGPAYLGLADLLLRRAGLERDSGKKRDALREIQQALESFRQIELEDHFRDDCVARYLARARGIEQVGARTAVLYPVPLPERLELVLTIGDSIHQVTVPIGLDALERESKALRALLEKRTTYQYLPHARKLYDWIVRPLEAVLAAANVDTIVVVPDRPLRNIPIGALHDGRDFLIARFAIATAPSLTLVEPTPLRTDTAVVLASGLTQSVQGFAALPHVGAELDAVGGSRTGAILRDQSFTTANLERELGSRHYSIVHVASHAQFAADSRQSFVLTYDGRLSIDRLEDHMKLNRYRDQPLELLFLSACQTAAGDERAALGLAGVAVKAGARSALATLWHINDQASSLLVAEFYRHIGQPGVSKAEALRRSQISLFNDLRYRHPGYWSPFLLIGNWL